MYKFKNHIILPTTASPINNNLTLFYPKDANVLASTLAVIHEGCVNIVPITSSSRRAKYIPIVPGEQSKGTVKQVKWVQLDGINYFVVLSTLGIQIYDEQISNVVYHHAVRETGDERSYTTGICVLRENVLCIGTCMGTVWMFQKEDSPTVFKVLNRVYAHDEALTLLDGEGIYMVSSSDTITYLWSFNNRNFDIIRKLEVHGVHAVASVIKFKLGIIVVGYSSGEFCIFDIKDEDFSTRTLAHKLGITGIDYSTGSLIVTVSNDSYLKTWKFSSNSVEPLQTIMDEDGPLYGVAFLNYSCTEFCTVTGEDAKVKTYVNWEKELEINVTPS